MRRTGGYRMWALVGWAVAVAVLAAGCSATPDGRWRWPDTAAPDPAASPTVTGGDVASCFDGECEIEVVGPVEVPLDPELRVTALRITVVGEGMVRIRASYVGGGSGVATLGGASVAILNDLTVRVVSIDDGKAVVTLSHQ